MARGRSGGGSSGGKSIRTSGASSRCDRKGYERRIQMDAASAGFDDVNAYMEHRARQRPSWCRLVYQNFEKYSMQCAGYEIENFYCNHLRKLFLECEAAKKETEENYKVAVTAANFVTINAYLAQLL